MPQLPRVRVVILHFGDPARTRQALAALATQTISGVQLDVVVVDNDPQHRFGPDTSIDGLEFRQIISDTNRGFGGGCNLGLEDLDAFDFVALLNNDALPEPTWLANLYDALVADPGASAATSKLLLDNEYARVRIALDHGNRSARGASSHHARLSDQVRVTSVRSADGEPLNEVFVKHRADSLDVLVPTDYAPVMIELTTTRWQRKHGPVALVLSYDDTSVTTTVGSADSIKIPALQQRVEVIANAGNDLTDTANATDRGWLEINGEDPFFDQQCQVFAWCGGAVLIRAESLRQTGVFDESLFLYYEDLELSWRANELGWHTIYVPTAVVRHEHAASSIEGSAFKALNTLRNRLVVLARHDRPARVGRLAARHIASIGVTAIRETVNRQRGGVANGTSAAVRAKAFGGFVTRLPGAIRARRSDTQAAQAVKQAVK
jgi:GT2 family glycosyltransferase